MAPATPPTFPRPLDAYPETEGGLLSVLTERFRAEPFNLIATIIFLLAIIHTFLAPVFQKMAHHAEEHHREQLERSGKKEWLRVRYLDPKEEVSFKAEILHFLGEIEAIFGIWVIPLVIAIVARMDWTTAKTYLSSGVNYTEPMFVVVIMSIAASRPVLRLAEQIMAVFAGIGKGSAVAWWTSILIIGPLLGSFITEPAAMTISALLLAQKFYDRKPTPILAYGTIGLLFVSVSIGGTLTHFAAPPVLMVAGKWGWNMPFMLQHFGWKAVIAIIASTAVYLLFFRKHFARLALPSSSDGDGMIRWENRDDPVPVWITIAHLLFLFWTVFTAHYPPLFVAGFLFFLAFTQATQHHQNDVKLKPALLVGFFLAGLVIHGGLQGWWIEPVLSRLSETPLFFGAMGLTAFNDNAAITYLASLVPNFSDAMKYAVVAGAVAGGGLTVIANAPNPAGQSILASYFPNGVSALHLALGALVPTATAALCFLLL